MEKGDDTIEKYHYFISYSRDIYTRLTEKLVLELQKYGLNLWLDKNEVVLGSNIYKNIDYVLENVKEWCGAILIIDATYLQKEWCNYEVDFFLKSNIKCLTVLFQMQKNNLPDKYTKLRELNLATILSEEDIPITIDKILLSFIEDMPAQVPRNIICGSDILKKCISYLNHYDWSDDNFVILCEIVCKILESNYHEYTYRENPFFPLFKIIHNKVAKLYKGYHLSYYEYKLNKKAIDYILLNTSIVQ